ncbi:MAG: Unknown protein [uncultured Sulfurovum sp.]|uniref:Uncharacterized protein n=1 Tax=uncultured Sulfurovum sp. TaxID=269237 RepID=A0A6S6S9I9_9BACT|nr:MAG: Unknown protein [uncultured Sulfurovum sp.]
MLDASIWDIAWFIVKIIVAIGLIFLVIGIVGAIFQAIVEYLNSEPKEKENKLSGNQMLILIATAIVLAMVIVYFADNFIEKKVYSTWGAGIVITLGVFLWAGAIGFIKDIFIEENQKKKAIEFEIDIQRENRLREKRVVKSFIKRALIVIVAYILFFEIVKYIDDEEPVGVLGLIIMFFIMTASAIYIFKPMVDYDKKGDGNISDNKTPCVDDNQKWLELQSLVTNSNPIEIKRFNDAIEFLSYDGKILIIEEKNDYIWEKWDIIEESIFKAFGEKIQIETVKLP